MKCFKNVSTVFALLSCICAGTSFAQPLKYRVIELGALSDSHSVHAYAINKHGQIVGKSGSKAFLWNPNGGMRDLGSLPGSKSSTAFDINSSGQIVGKSGNRAFIFNPRSGMAELPVTALANSVPADKAVAYGINDNGYVVGVATIYGNVNTHPGGEFQNYGILWNHPLRMREGGSYQEDLNAGYKINAKDIAIFGENDGASSTTYKVLGKDNVETINIIGLSRFKTLALGINDESHVVGTSATMDSNESQTSKAFYWHPEKGTLELEGSERSAAFAINNKNHVVGRCGTTFNFACMWLTPEEMIELSATLENNDSKKIILHEARGINDSGQIIANGTINGQQRAFLLNPVDSSYESQQKYVRQKR